MMRRISAFVLAAGLFAGSFATDSRVEVMGRHHHPWFYRDEVTMFVNPADANTYTNMLYGSFGTMGSAASGMVFTDERVDNPFFGAVLAIGGDDDGTGAISIGAFANRRDYMLEWVTSASPAMEPVGLFDAMVGYNLGGGISFGLGYYGAFNSVINDGDATMATSLHKITAGANIDMGQIAVEVAANYGMINSFAGTDTTHDGDMFLRGDVRLFSDISEQSALVVPVSFKYLDILGTSGITLEGGAGVNVKIDRGFFFAGAQVVYRGLTEGEGDAAVDYTDLGGRLTFGIERNIVWDWFMIRVGGQKELVRSTSGDISVWEETVASDGSPEDLVGLGFGVNIDNRLRVDVTVTEDLPYTFTNLLSGNMSRLFSRVSATFRF